MLENKDIDLEKKIAATLPKIPESSVVIFVETGLPDRRKSLFKALNQPKKAQLFDLLAGERLKDFIAQAFKDEEINISRENLYKFALYVGADPWRIENETRKLALYAKSQKREEVLEGDIELLILSPNDSNIFDLIDFIASKKGREAAEALFNLLSAGENELYLLSMIVYQYRNLLLIERGLERKAKLHPFVVRKSKALLSHYDREKLENIYHLLQRTDAEIKSGAKESKLALNLLVAKLCT